MQNFISLASIQTDKGTFLTIFEENFRIFQENSLANSKKNPNLKTQFYIQPKKALACKISALLSKF
jgi:hypothetical protein